MESLALAFQVTATIRQLQPFAPALQRQNNQVVAVVLVVETVFEAQGNVERAQDKAHDHQALLQSIPALVTLLLGSHTVIELSFQLEDSYIEASSVSFSSTHANSQSAGHRGMSLFLH